MRVHPLNHNRYQNNQTLGAFTKHIAHFENQSLRSAYRNTIKPPLSPPPKPHYHSTT